MLELVHLHIKEALEFKTYSTFDGYWEWCKQLLDLSYVYMQHMKMTYLHAHTMVHSGIRKCSSALI